MTFKAILFCLFLYVCLVWVGAVYFYSGVEVEHFGLLWTGVGFATVLLLILLAKLFGWVRLLRTSIASRPKPIARAAVPLHEDDAALMALLNEASATLGRMAVPPDGQPVTLATLPVYLLIGPEQSGKTSTFLNAGLEPQLLAGQAGSGLGAATRLCNIWLAQEKLFIEIAGRVFSGEPERWQRLLRLLQVKPALSRWQRLWNDPPRGLDLRAAVAFCDAKDFLTAANPQGRERLDRQSQFWQERLGTLAEAHGFPCPVYVLITKCDAIPFFPEYFRRFHDSEASQALGCALTSDGTAASTTAEGDSKKLTKAFNALFYSFAGRRLTQLAKETDTSRRPAIYEFPREFKRIRSTLVPFLTSVFRPHPLRPSPQLRGYYFSATGERAVEQALGDSKTQWTEQSVSLEATVLFKPGATQILRGGGSLGASERFPAAGTQRRWLFVSEFFRAIIPAAPTMIAGPPLERASAERSRLVACAALCGVCLLLCTVWINSWMGNLALLRSVREEGAAPRHGGPPTLTELQSLEYLRSQVDRLVLYDRDGPPLRLRWGLYAGNSLLKPMKDLYFRDFQNLLLNPLDAALTAPLAALTATPAADAAYNPVYRALKTHLMISSGVCKPDPRLVIEVLDATREQAMPGESSEWQILANKQIAFYANELPFGNPCRLPENTAARERARQYLMNIQGPDRIYGGIMAAAETAFPKPQRLADLAPSYTDVLSGAGKVAGVFTSEGWAYVQKASEGRSSEASGEDCVSGGGVKVGGLGARDRDSQSAVQRLFIRDYIEHWRNYVASFSVLHYAGPADAARKLEILSDHKSPLLALFAMTSNQTNFAAPLAAPDNLERVAPVVKKLFPSLGAKASNLPNNSLPGGASNQTDITKAFQPVHWVVPAGSETWVVDKNNAYVEALTALSHSIRDIARASTPAEQAVLSQTASQNYDRALDAARQIARGFEPVGVGGLDVTVERLLEAPIRQTQSFIVTDAGGATAGKVNAQLHTLCEQLRLTLHKYPFQANGPDATLEEVAVWFAPNTGAVWRFQAQSLAELTVKEGGRWRAKDPAQKPQVTPEMLTFLNRAQTLSDAFYPNGTAQAQVTYTLRPKLDASFEGVVVEFNIDGQIHPWTSSLQKQFTWPAAPGSKELGVKGSVRINALSFPFTSRAGVWAIFKVMGDAEPRAIGNRIVEWREIRGGNGRGEAITPAPVRLEFVQFPGGADLFNTKFFQDFLCPAKAVQ